MAQRSPAFIGHDGMPYGIGDTVELHPSLLRFCWFWSDRYAVVVGSSLTPNDRVRVRLGPHKRLWSGSEDTFKKVAA